MSQHARIVTGRLIGPRTVELDESVEPASGRVEVVLPESRPHGGAGKLSDYVAALPLRGIPKQELDRYLREERDSWGNR